MIVFTFIVFIFFFNDTATTKIYTLPLHAALPIWLRASPATEDRSPRPHVDAPAEGEVVGRSLDRHAIGGRDRRSEEHTSELQSRQYLVCRLLLEKKKTSTEPINMRLVTWPKLSNK